MPKTIISDFSRVLLFPKDTAYTGGLNELNKSLLSENEEYPFLEYFSLNEELLKYYEDLNESTPVYIFTSETIQNHPSIKRRLYESVTGVLSAVDLGVHKTDPAAYEKLLGILKLNVTDVLYIDDKQVNLEAASTIGLATILHVNNVKTIHDIEKYIN